jgi:mono/diheme cytochrome c family protein
MARRVRAGATGLALATGLLGAGCRQDMHDQPRYKPLGRSAFFADGRASRPLVEGTVARGRLVAGGPYDTGRTAAGELVRAVPLAADAALLARGRERYDIHCAVCHDRVGTGRGMIVQRGFRPPPSLHETRLREAPDGYLFDVVSRGFGVMPAYGRQVAVRDRWAIVAYLRALQLSQRAGLADVPAPARARLEAGAE